MKILIIGGSASGKSEYAENIAQSLNEKRYYVATMMPFGNEALKRIEKHRNMRKLKGFETIEKYTDIEEIEIEKNSALLLECMGNIVANEIYRPDPKENIKEHILSGVDNLSQKCQNIVVVSNDVFSDGIEYPEETKKYMEILSDIDRHLASSFDVVAEVVCGIPLKIKGDLIW